MAAARASIVVLFCCALVAGCTKEQAASNGYKPGVEPGMPRERVEALLGKPKSATPFSLSGGISAEVLDYPFGQVLTQNGRVVAITIANAPTYVGPFGITIGMSEDGLKAAFHANPRARKGHLDQYNLISGQTNTRTRDIFDDTDGLILEMVASNPNDPFAPFRVVSVTQCNSAGRALLMAITKAKINGLYTDEQVVNYTSDPWTTAAKR